MRHVILGAIVALAVPTAALAKGPAYVGTWGNDTAKCGVDQSDEKAPFIFRTNRYDRHEVHCAFTSVKKHGATWTVKARCDVEGDKQRPTFTIAVAGDTLTMDKVTLNRCK